MAGTLPLLTRRGDTLGYDRERGIVRILDRRRYPGETIFMEYDEVEGVARAIEEMVIQGGPPLAYVAGYGLALAARKQSDRPMEAQRSALAAAAKRLLSTRPTADDLHHIMREALQRGEQALERGESAEDLILRYVKSEVDRGDRVAERCGKRAAELLTDGDSILTVCFAGAALNWMLYEAAVTQEKRISIICTETRPYLQGARLAAAQAVQIGLPTTVITDNMPGFCLRRGMVSVYITAADRIALDGSAANKVGTYQCAVLARHHQVPFYVLGYDGPDPATASGEDIPIEERNGDEVLYSGGVRTAAEGARGYYPAFDVTPPELINAIVTDRGIYRPELIARYLSDGDAPLDVLPMISG